MIWLDRKFLAETGCYLYRKDDFNDCETILDLSFDSNEMYEDCMFRVVKHNDRYYFFGASRNGLWRGYEITKKYAERLKNYSIKRIEGHFKHLEEKMFWKSPYNGGLE